MEEVAIVLPYRFNPLRDSYVLPLCLQAWSRLQPGAIILVDSSEEKVQLPKIDNLVHLYRPYEGPFNLSFMRNVGGRYAADNGFKFVQMMDADIFPASNNYLEACIAMMDKFHMLRPLVINSPDKIPNFNALQYNKYLDFLNVDITKAPRKTYSYSTMFQNIEVLKRIHGWDEAFKMWGAEDDDYLHRATQAGFKAGSLAGQKLIHSHHVGDTAKKSREGPYYQENFNRWRQGMAGQLPIVRMPEDWGLYPIPR